MIIKPEDFCCSDFIGFCHQGIGIILFSSHCGQHMLLLWKVSIFCAKVRKSHLWSMRLTTGRDSSHVPVILAADVMHSIHTHTNA